MNLVCSLSAVLLVATFAEAYIIPGSQNGWSGEGQGNAAEARILNDLDDIQQVLSQMRSDTGSYPDRPDFDLTSLPSSSMGRLFGERNLGNRQISAFKPTGGSSGQNLADARGHEKRNYNLDHLARMNFRRSFRASKFNDRHILGGL